MKRKVAHQIPAAKKQKKRPAAKKPKKRKPTKKKQPNPRKQPKERFAGGQDPPDENSSEDSEEDTSEEYDENIFEEYDSEGESPEGCIQRQSYRAVRSRGGFGPGSR